jgi:hypothetical protein
MFNMHRISEELLFAEIIIKLNIYGAMSPVLNIVSTDFLKELCVFTEDYTLYSPPSFLK